MSKQIQPLIKTEQMVLRSKCSTFIKKNEAKNSKGVIWVSIINPSHTVSGNYRQHFIHYLKLVILSSEETPGSLLIIY